MNLAETTIKGAPSQLTILEGLRIIPDPRIERCQKHPLISILFIALCGALCGADNWVDIEVFGTHSRDWLEKFVALPNGVPSHDTFGRVFSLIDSAAFRDFFAQWTSDLAELTQGDVVAFDGKTLRRSFDKARGKQALHLVNAWSLDNGLCLGQMEVDEKSNEITALPKLIELLNLKGCVVTADALNTQKSVAQAIVKAGADYVLPIKDNHPTLRADVELYFQDGLQREFKGVDCDYYETLEKDHGRIERRRYFVIDADWLQDRQEWEGLKSLGMVIRERWQGKKHSTETVYYLMSTEPEARLLERSSRGHWGIEAFHWRLDVIMREDENRYRDRLGAENMSLLRKLTLNLLVKDKKTKAGGHAKRLRAAISPAYREQLLTGGKL